MASGPEHDFARLVEEIGGALRTALIAELGPEFGAAATTAAFRWGRSHMKRLSSASNPAHQLHRAGRRRSLWYLRRAAEFPEVPAAATQWIDPALPQALATLRPQDRAAVVLSHGYGWSRVEVGEVLGIDDSAEAPAAAVGFARLQSALDDGTDGHSRELRDQLVAYAELLDGAAPGLEELIPSGEHHPLFAVRWQLGVLIALTVVGALVIVRFAADEGDRSSTTAEPLAGAATTSAAPALPPVEVELVNRSAISPATFSNWVHHSAAPGAVAVVNGTYHMLSAAYGGNVATVAYAVSDDGVVWAQATDRPVLDLSEAPWVPREFDRATPRSVVVDSEGTWQLFFDASWFDRGTNQARASIGRVVARDPTGIWTFDSQPVVTREAEYPWMAARVWSPSVIAADGTFIMLFVGEGNSGEVVGLAQSENGADWELRPGPVFSAAADWEGEGISQVDLLAIPDGMAMFYAGSASGRRGLALSDNGLEWSPHPNNPLLAPADAAAPLLFDSEFVYNGSTVLAYLETGSSRSEHEVAVLRLDLDIASVMGPILGTGS
jgi:hypothetical protein